MDFAYKHVLMLKVLKLLYTLPLAHILVHTRFCSQSCSGGLMDFAYEHVLMLKVLKHLYTLDCAHTVAVAALWTLLMSMCSRTAASTLRTTTATGGCHFFRHVVKRG